ncbi:MAG: TMEM198/TM7SF3 family protein [Gammaproteobacteria bacterium]|nr:TMEM198/TM7SF3 family protein [Gammaproteobacteria bacterium]
MSHELMLPTNGWVGVVIAIGAIQCCFGYRAFKAVLVLVGFALGYGLAYTAIDLSFHHKYAAFFAGVIAGVVGGSLINNVYLIGVFVVSGLFGAAVALHLYAIAGQHPEPIMLFLFAALAGLFALFFQKLMIILATSLSGAWGVVAGVAWFAGATINPISIGSVEKYFRTADTQGYLIGACWLVLSIVGVLFQYRRLPGMNAGYTSEVKSPPSA